MQNITCGFTNQNIDSIRFEPMTDLNPTNEQCIYSTLFIISQAKKSLWLKAMRIADGAGLDIVIRLGGFHTMMSYLGAIDDMMKYE